MTTDRNHEMSSDEVRRQLRDAQAEHDASMPAWRGSLDHLLDSGTHDTIELDIRGERRQFAAYRVDEGVVWGLTERIVSDLLRLI